MSPLLIIITGLPAAGKTTLASALGAQLQLPVVSKDDYKQVLLDLMPEDERLIRNSEAGKAGYFVMLKVAEVLLTAGRSLIMETHFYRGVSELNLLPLAERHQAQVLQIFCDVGMEELKLRHAARVAAQTRPYIDHPNIHDRLPENANREPLDLRAPLLRVNTAVPDAAGKALTWLAQWR